MKFQTYETYLEFKTHWDRYLFTLRMDKMDCRREPTVKDAMFEMKRIIDRNKWLSGTHPARAKPGSTAAWWESCW